MVQCIGKLIYHVIESAKCHFYAETTRLCFICKMISRYLADVINPIDTKGHIFGAAFISDSQVSINRYRHTKKNQKNLYR